jgi:hypothetical protein
VVRSATTTFRLITLWLDELSLQCEFMRGDNSVWFRARPCSLQGSDRSGPDDNSWASDGDTSLARALSDGESPFVTACLFGPEASTIQSRCSAALARRMSLPRSTSHLLSAPTGYRLRPTALSLRQAIWSCCATANQARNRTRGAGCASGSRHDTPNDRDFARHPSSVSNAPATSSREYRVSPTAIATSERPMLTRCCFGRVQPPTSSKAPLYRFAI